MTLAGGGHAVTDGGNMFTNEYLSSNSPKLYTLNMEVCPPHLSKAVLKWKCAFSVSGFEPWLQHPIPVSH